MAAEAAQHPARFDTVLSFSHGADRPTADEADAVASSSSSSYDSDDDAGFEFAFAPPLVPASSSALAPADHLFAHGRILPAYPVFDRHLLLADDHREDPTPTTASAAAAAPPSPGTYCAWAPRSAPGSPVREAPPPPFPKSASTGDARRFWRLPHLGGGGRSHSDGKDKFVFLQQPGAPATASSSRMSQSKAAAEGKKQATAKPSAPPQQKQSKKKGSSKAAPTEMDMATAHRLFYSKQGAAGAHSGDRRQAPPQHSYLPYRTGIVGFFASAHAVGRAHHPY